jgi:hypothetical protein
MKSTGIKILMMVIICFTVTNCKESRNDENQTDIKKPVQYFFSSAVVGNKLVETNIDTLSNFNSLLKILDENDCYKEYAIFNLETKDKIYKIQPQHFCEGSFHYRLKDIIYVNSDSITVNSELKFPIDSLKSVLRNHLLNPNQDKNYPLAVEQKLISVHVDSLKPVASTKTLLLSIINNINELGGKSNMQFLFGETGIYP